MKLLWKTLFIYIYKIFQHTKLSGGDLLDYRISDPL